MRRVRYNHGISLVNSVSIFLEEKERINGRNLTNGENVLLSHPLIKCSIPSKRASNTEFWCAHVISLNKLLNKQSISWWFETPWRTCNVNVTLRNYFGFAMKIYSLYLFTMCTESVYTEKTWTTRICMFNIPASISGYAIFCKFLTPLLTMVLSPKVLFKLLLKLKLLFSMCKYI